MSSVVISGDTSGSITLAAPAVAGTNTITLPAGTGTIAVQGSSTNIVRGTAVASTSGTSIDFNSIPSWVKRITVMLNGVSTNGSSELLIRLGSGSIETTSYVSVAGYAGGPNQAGSTSSTAGFILTSSLGATSVFNAVVTICNQTANTWSEGFSGSYSTVCAFGGGYKALSGVLDRVRITTINGTDTFDAGSINILYE
jgi:hypothetical protein